MRNNEKGLEEYVREWPKHPGLIETKWKPERSHKKDKVKNNNKKNKEKSGKEISAYTKDTLG